MQPDLEALLAARDGPVRLWWRDDDAGRDHPALDRLLRLARTHRAPLGLAVVPEWLEPGAIDRICMTADVTVLQHGIAHQDHAGPGERRIELGGLAEPARLADRIVDGRESLARAFGDRCRPVMVPPWNRIGAAFVELLPKWGFRGMSGWAGSGPATPAALVRIDTHLDAMSWRPERRCLDLSELVTLLTRAIREGHREPLGLLTHHLAVDSAGFQALDRLVGLVQDHPKLCLQSASDLFQGPE